jgi:hypothetical protein
LPKNIGSVLLAFAVLAAVFLLVGLFAVGTAVFVAIVLPIISVVSALGIVACLIAFLPMAAFKKTRPISAIGLYALSYVFGLELWIFSFLETFDYLGVLGIVLGFILAGVGFVPIAIIAAAVHGIWPDVMDILLLIAATYGARALGLFLAAKIDAETRIDRFGGPIIEHEP